MTDHPFVTDEDRRRRAHEAAAEQPFTFKALEMMRRAYDHEILLAEDEKASFRAAVAIQTVEAIRSMFITAAADLEVLEREIADRQTQKEG